VEQSETSRRKSEHLRIVLEEQVLHPEGTLLDGVRLVHQALPELDLSEIDTSAPFFGKRLAAPLLIASMSGGAEHTGELNHQLAAVAERCGVAFAVGSQRAMLEHPELRADYAVRPSIPSGVLLGNIGAPQLPQLSTETVAELGEAIEADALCVHLNPAQELVQPEGDRSFRGQLAGISALVERLKGRVLVKETGAGLAPETLQRLRTAGVLAVDVAGSGGTSWTRVEAHRAPPGPGREIGETLAGWGIPTAFCVVAARRILGEQACVVAGGGIRHGLDVARAIALGADLCSLARPVLVAWQAGGPEGAEVFVRRLMAELRAVLLLTGCRDLAALRVAPRVLGRELRDWLAVYSWVER
jgi:isopentenyl-diphosphate Delta-isomerase